MPQAEFGFSDLWPVIGAICALSIPVGALALRGIEWEDRLDARFAGLASAGAGFMLFGGAASILVLLSGRATPIVMWMGWALALGVALLLGRSRGPFARDVYLSSALSVPLVFLAAWFILAPVHTFPVSPDYDGTADGYFAAITKIGGTFPRFSTLGGSDFMEVNAPPAPAVIGAFLSHLTGTIVSRVQLTQGGTAWALYWLAVPFAAYALFRATPFRVAGPIVAAIASYTLSLRWTYYDGANTRLSGILALVLATAFFLRWLEARAGRGRAAVLTGVMLGCAALFHSRYFIFGMLSMGLFTAILLIVEVARGRRQDARDTLAGSLTLAAIAIGMTLVLIAPDLGGLTRTGQHEFWQQPRLTLQQMLAYIERFQGTFVFFLAPAAAVLLLLVSRGRRGWAYVSTAVLAQIALSFDAAFFVLPPLRMYADGLTTASSGFSDVRPLVFAGLLLLPAGLFAASPSRMRRTIGGGAAVAGAIALFVTAYRPPITASYTYLTPGDVSALTWIRANTPVEGTLVLNYPWWDLPDATLEAQYGFANPRGTLNVETYWVTPVSERRAVFHWTNRLLHEGIWNIVRASSPDLLTKIEALGHAYLHPCAPGSYETLRDARVTHVFVTAIVHTILAQTIDSCGYLKPVFNATPPFEGYYGRPESGFRPGNPALGAAVYEVVAPR